MYAGFRLYRRESGPQCGIRPKREEVISSDADALDAGARTQAEAPDPQTEAESDVITGGASDLQKEAQSDVIVGEVSASQKASELDAFVKEASALQKEPEVDDIIGGGT